MIFSILAFLALFIGICLKDRKASLRMQSLKCLFESIYALTISAYTVAGLGFLNFIRTYLFSLKDKFNKLIYFCMLIIFETIIILNCIYTWDGWISVVPTIASVIRTYCMWQSNMTYIRISSAITALLFGIYYIYYQGWFMLAGNILLFVISMYAIFTHDLKLFKKIHFIQNTAEQNKGGC